MENQTQNKTKCKNETNGVPYDVRSLQVSRHKQKNRKQTIKSQNKKVKQIQNRTKKGKKKKTERINNNNKDYNFQTGKGNNHPTI